MDLILFGKTTKHGIYCTIKAGVKVVGIVKGENFKYTRAVEKCSSLYNANRLIVVVTNEPKYQLKGECKTVVSAID